MGNQEIKGSLGQGQGYRVISVSDGSPCHQAGINFFTDFIVDIIPAGQNNEENADDNNILEFNGDGQYVVDEKKDFFQIVSEHENKQLKMVIYDILQRKIRIVKVVPNKDWSNQQNLLGVMLRLENYLNSHDNTFKVVTVDENSPAKIAGLQAKQDYIIGLKKYKYEGLDELINIIFDNEGQEIELVVFNISDKSVRSVMLKPQMNWGGRGLIGCEFGGGYLNQLPVILDEAAELQRMEEEQKKLDSLNKFIHKSDPPAPKQQLSSDPPPTNIQVQQEQQQPSQSGSKIVAHQLHQINILRAKKNSHHEHVEVVHNKDPFAVQRKYSNDIQQQNEVKSVDTQNQNVEQNNRRNSSSQFNQSQQNGQQQENRQVSKSLTSQSIQNNNINQAQNPEQFSSNILERQNETKEKSKSQTFQQQQQVVFQNDELINQSRKESLSNRQYEFEVPNIQKKYIIMEKDLFNLKIKLQNQQLVI
ncbi:GRASP55/65 family protein (macronuclear) [Tetrahymena thermophila SB210]|uniref:GRASP55/65 family protein n=1 Tax=Tetrahymena thermophila (strain SB210) TaxID=312017 RepID=Q22G20_TETTS|nr:GRASP55/65 family protein [Tetrahymena thermophila SB210]EAR84206.1 GRASP55/65 family protein [Tetrahymena thermophila SB210]|eukprot:XP_001031869.1 GRASP55/65 family protein [Tetrahymena thermophila SB210]